MGRIVAVSTGLPHLHPAMSDPSMPVINVTARACAVMMREAAAARNGCETGGVLLGHTAGRHATVVHAGTPGANAVVTPNRFVRDLIHAQAFANACYAADGSMWIGEWHTHPHSAPLPSELDASTYAQLLGDSELGFTVFISLILAPVDTAVAVAGWWAAPDDIAPAQVRICQESNP